MKPLILCVMLAAAAMLSAAEPEPKQEKNMSVLTVKEEVIVDIGAAVARGEQKTLASALNRGFDAGLTLSEAKEYVGAALRLLRIPSCPQCRNHAHERREGTERKEEACS